MKLKKLIVLAGLVANIAFANDTVIITEMKNMRDSMNQINDGFFYNKKDKITQGLKSLKNANEIFKTQSDVKLYLPEKIQHMSGISFNNAIKINVNIDKMQRFINKNNYRKASIVYMDIINSCTSCHSIVRGW